ncbi:MAG: hypothetical protein OXI23_16135, partial [Gemmatimonadota bacterium]|nr:hypothetical protein [Gemmatimonadota bacterium]
TRDAPPTVRSPCSSRSASIRVPDLEAAARRLTDMGYEIFSDGLGGKEPLAPDKLEEGAFKVEDPDGITVDITSSDDQWPGTGLPAG